MASEPRRDDLDPTDAYVYLGVGAAIGVALLLHPLIWVTWWWEPLANGLREGQRTGLWKPGLVLASVLGGLAVMFACFQSARKFERIDPNLRRVLYGYNAVLTGLLVLALLVIVNVAVHLWAPRYLDTTAGGFHTLSDVTQKFVGEIDKPVHVYVIMAERSEAYANTLTLLSQFRDLNPRYFAYEEISPTLARGRVSELVKKFPQLNTESLVVAYGEKEDNYSVIPSSELENTDFDPMGGRATQRQFNGEVRLMQELTYLAENKKKPVVYFTQGHGEPDEADPREEGMASLRLKLMKANYDVRALKIDATIDAKDAVVPPDADVVIVCGPKRAMGSTVSALRKYLAPVDPAAPKGRLIVMLGPTPPDKTRGNIMTETGLEALLREFNVNLTGEQVLTFMLPSRDRLVIDQSPERVVMLPTQEAVDARQPIAQTFKEQQLQWFDCRKVEPLQNSPPNPSGGNFTALVVMGSYGLVWTETDMLKPASDVRRLMATSETEFKKRAIGTPVPVMVAVTEGAADPHRPSQTAKPRLLVIGTSTIATNQLQGQQGGVVDYDLIRGSIDWCRERYGSIGVQPKTYSTYALPKVSFAKLFVLPSLLMLLAIFGMGMVVWNMRRR